MKRIFSVLLLMACCLVFSRQVRAGVDVMTWVGSVDYGGGNIKIVGTGIVDFDYTTMTRYCVEGWTYLYRDGTHLGSHFVTNHCQDVGGFWGYVEVPDNVPNAEYVVDANFTVTPIYTAPDADFDNFYGTFINPPYIFSADNFGFYGAGPPSPNYGSVLLGTVYGIFQRGNPALNQGRCGDVRDNIRREYVTHQVNIYPACANFTQTRQGQYFTFNELNTGDYAWALIRDPLVSFDGEPGLDQWRSLYGVSRICNSCYRNPARNAGAGGARQSRHMYGDAADLRNQSLTENEWALMYEAALEAGASFVGGRYTDPCGLNCVHADWRNDPGGYQ